MGSLASRTPRVARPERVTLEAWAELDEDDTRELVDGVLVEGEMTNVGHVHTASAAEGELRPPRCGGLPRSHRAWRDLDAFASDAGRKKPRTRTRRS